MPFIEKQRHGNVFYYYLVKSVRISASKVKKVRIFLGTKVPPHEKLQELFRELERKTPKPYSARWLPKDIVERIEDLHASVTVLRRFPESVIPEDFLVRFTYNTNAIEGNPLTLRQTALILSENIAPQGVKTDDVVEVMNGKDAWEFVKDYKGIVNVGFLKNIQHEVTKNTKCRLQGKYRDSEVRIGGSEWVPPKAKEVPDMMKGVVREYKRLKRTLHPLELAAWLHNKIAQIHPFTDGNGRTARLAMNWILMRKRFPPIIIDVRNKEEYYHVIEAADAGDQKPFCMFLAKQMLEQYAILEKAEKESQKEGDS
jgi:Fic family protein